jgi:hypothetical protein
VLLRGPLASSTGTSTTATIVITASFNPDAAGVDS